MKPRPLATVFLFALACFISQKVAIGETLVQQRAASARRMTPLTKLTIGPDDQYHGVPDPTGTFLFFTHKADLVSHLKVQNLKTGQATSLLPLNADSQEPAVAQNGNIAFTYYKLNARGDICYIEAQQEYREPVTDSKIHCLNRSAQETDTERASPFWKSNTEVGFVVRDIQNKVWKIVTQSLLTGQTTTLAEGKVWSPSMRAGGKYLIYEQIATESGSPQRNLVLADLSTGQKKVLRFSLPGISGFPSLSEDEQYVYFSHYLNDTNHDNVIDGSDNAVIFRASVRSLLATPEGQEFFPEQLTSVESSCSFPRTLGNELFVTCAFEGNLDVYQLPAQGIIPATWDKAILENALQTARSYQDRILILNTMKFRTQAATSVLFTQMLLTNHILADDPSAALYYLAKAKQGTGKGERAFYDVLGIYLRAKELKKAQTSEEITRAFRDQLSLLQTQLDQIPGEPEFHKVVHGLLAFFLGDHPKAQAYLSQVNDSHTDHAAPIQLMLTFELASHVQPSLNAYIHLMLAPHLSKEAKLFYAFSALQFIEDEAHTVPGRLAKIEQLNQNFIPAVKTLIESEKSVLKLIHKPDAGGKAFFYRELDKLISASKDDYFLRKALYVRAIVNFSKAGEVDYLRYVVTNWIRYTNRTDTEFDYAREVFANASLDQGYIYLGKGQLADASAFFYGSILQTDDLESHYNYIQTMIKDHQRAILKDRYQNFTDRKIVEENIHFVDALLGFIDAPGKLSSIDQALENLNLIEHDRDSPIRYLLLGYCHLQKLLLAARGLDFDQDLFLNGHRELMLAYELGKDNARIRAAATQNLGILHQRVQNAAISARFFAIRKTFGFNSPAEQAQFEWLFAQSLYDNREAKEAALELNDVKPELKTAAFQERQGFYWMAAGQYQEAAERFETLIHAAQIKGDLNLAKANLNLGFSWLKLGKKELAKSAFLRSLESLNRLEAKPENLQTILYGFIAQTSVAAERQEALKHRDELLKNQKASLDEWLMTCIQNKLQLAEVSLALNQNDVALQAFRESLGLVTDYGQQNQFFGSGVYHTLSNTLATGLLQPQLFSAEDLKIIEDFAKKTLTAYAAQSNAPPVLQYQLFKMKLLWTAFQKKVLHQSPTDKLEQPESFKQFDAKQRAEITALRNLI